MLSPSACALCGRSDDVCRPEVVVASRNQSVQSGGRSEIEGLCDARRLSSSCNSSRATRVYTLMFERALSFCVHALFFFYMFRKNFSLRTVYIFFIFIVCSASIDAAVRNKGAVH